jgi:2-polyprenyl-3-methyl-5-hydroxy-6-metoxy-1,4-benzoquinol methylase
MESHRKRGGKLRYVDTVKPEDFIPDFGDINSHRVSLAELADAHGSDKGTLKHNYCAKYEEVISSICAKNQKRRELLDINLLEIGVACGASLRTWSHYLPSSSITGLDIREDCKHLCADLANIDIMITDATDSKRINLTLGNTKYDLIIDDGSHVSEHISKTFELLWPRVKPGGFYAIEDLACTYNTNYAKHIKNSFGIDVNNHRGTILQMMDAILKACDQHRFDISGLTYSPQLLLIEKI